MCIYDKVLVNSSQNEKCFRQKFRKNQNTHFYVQLAGVPGVTRDGQWRNRIAMLCII